MYQLVRDILIGDDNRAAADVWHTSEDGMMSFVGLIAVLFFVILIGLVGNVGLTVNQKIGVQNAADSTAYSSGVFVARGMNAVTASNHIIGELLALCIIHQAIRGPEGDGGSPPFESTPISSSERNDAEKTKRQLRYTHKVTTFAANLAVTFGPRLDDGIYNSVSQGPKQSEGAMIFRAKHRLMKVLKSSYRVWGVGAVMNSLFGSGYFTGAVFYANLSLFDPSKPFREARNSQNRGDKIATSAKVFADKVGKEWDLLTRISDIAASMSSTKAAMKGMILTIYRGTQDYASGRRMESQHRKLLDELDDKHGVSSVTFFGRAGGSGFFSKTAQLRPDLPITPEPADLPSIEKSQLVRATWPWVAYRRQPLLPLFRYALRLSRAAHHYKDFTNQFTLEIARELKDRHGLNLYIMKELDLAQSDKGMEPWTEPSRTRDELRDRLFTHVGFAHRDAPPLASSGFFKAENDDGFVCFAQAIVYNANPQIPHRPKPRNIQPRVAWDTLNWSIDVPEYQQTDGHASYLGGGDSDTPDHEPRIYINWRTKLVPTSRLKEASRSLPQEFARAVKRLPLQTWSREAAQFRTH